MRHGCFIHIRAMDMLKVFRSSYKQQRVDNVNHGIRWDGDFDFWW